MAVTHVEFDQDRRPGEAPQRARVASFQHALPDRRNHAARQQLLGRVRAEFEELGGLKLTLAQAQRLFDLREDICRRVLHTLIGEGLLCVTADDQYARRREGDARLADTEMMSRP